MMSLQDSGPEQLSVVAKRSAEALTNSVSLCMWLVNTGRYFSGYNLLLKNVNFQ